MGGETRREVKSSRDGVHRANAVVWGPVYSTARAGGRGESDPSVDTKARKLEQLVRLKEAKVQTLLNKLQALSAQ